MRKIMTIVGTRPELIKMSRVITALDEHFHQILIHTGQNFDYELNEIFYHDLGIRRPDQFLAAAAAGPIETIANVLIHSDAAMEREQPDAVLIYGDTNSGLACIAAKRRKIPIFHFEAGNRSHQVDKVHAFAAGIGAQAPRPFMQGSPPGTGELQGRRSRERRRGPLRQRAKD